MIPHIFRWFPALMAATLTALLFTSCEKEETGSDTGLPVIVPGEGLFLLNEGNFGWGNASLSYYNKVSKEIHHHLYQKANSAQLGDVLQSAYITSNELWLMVNNSGKVIVTDPVSLKQTKVLSGLTSPRYMTTAANATGYITDLYAGKVHIVDTQQKTIKGDIEVNGWTEEIMMWGDYAVTTGVEAGRLYAIDTATNELVDSLDLPPGPVSMTTDHQGHLWVLAGGDPLIKTQPILYQVDRESFTIRGTHSLPDEEISYSRLVTCPDGETLYFLGGDVYRMSVIPEEPSPEVFIEADGRILYGLGVDPDNGDIYVSDAVDYVQRGQMLRHDPDGSLIDIQDAGIIPGGFTFY